MEYKPSLQVGKPTFMRTIADDNVAPGISTLKGSNASALNSSRFLKHLLKDLNNPTRIRQDVRNYGALFGDETLANQNVSVTSSIAPQVIFSAGGLNQESVTISTSGDL